MTSLVTFFFSMDITCWVSAHNTSRQFDIDCIEGIPKINYTNLALVTVTVLLQFHYCDVIMGAMASQITSLTIAYSTVYSGAIKENINYPRH